ncbi:MAG: methyltransferase [Candidatus Eisenbacteria bacterium]|nr:methyltransferase [Candidatus Eisenbacteria bacterium]
MKPRTTADVLDLMGSYIASSALNVALEVGLFWLLKERPETTESVARSLHIPSNRCRYWLELLRGMGLLDREGAAYSVSPDARTAILDAYSKETWMHLAEEERERYPAGRDLALHIRRPGTVWATQGLEPPDYVKQMEESIDRARSFTRMLYEIHKPLAEEVAGRLDLTGVKKLMDLGGGSGAVSLALLRRNPQLACVVVDIENVCVAGRELAAENSMQERIVYHSADIIKDKLPSDFDMVLECDVGIYDEALFRKVRDVLNPQGRFVIVGELAREEGVAPLSRLDHAFWRSLDDLDYEVVTVPLVHARLAKVGFHPISEETLQNGGVVIQSGK